MNISIVWLLSAEVFAIREFQLGLRLDTGLADKYDKTDAEKKAEKDSGKIMKNPNAKWLYTVEAQFKENIEQNW